MPDFLRTDITRHGVRFVDQPELKTIVDELTALVDGASGGRQKLKLMVKVGGSAISVGDCADLAAR